MEGGYEILSDTFPRRIISCPLYSVSMPPSTSKPTLASSGCKKKKPEDILAFPGGIADDRVGGFFRVGG
jgi:hypothetical protein